ncbi:ABC transporter substrate-binding protein [Piscinibacter sakaiensis]|uniref:ABC transporter substrate-binding protein n=1 Tax=Piscinibacter sakaiensis TaxID=1547922 RepID=UPI0037296E68
MRLRPQTAAALPEVSADHRSLTFRIRPGIFFADHPAFGGRPRELVAQDYVYTVKRYYDPRLNAENVYFFENAKILDLAGLREQARRSGRPLDVDREVEGIRALDRYTFRVRLAEPAPRVVHLFANATLTGAIAREVVEAHGEDIAAHPVGTGLAAWRRASQVVLERNPGFREQRWEAEPAPDDAEGQRMAQRLRGRRLPLVDRIEVNVIEETQPRWLAFANGDLDVLELPPEYAPIAVPNGVLAPHLARRGVRLRRQQQADMTMSYFNMDDPLVGGLAPEKVALRRAVALAYDNAADLRLIRNGQGIVAESTLVPHTSGYDPAYRSEMGRHDRARAMALLDLYGYVDRDGDGWREQPDGRPLVLRLASLPDQRSRAINALWRKQMAAVGLRIVFDVASWPELLKKGRAGQLMMWGFSWTATSPDGGFFLGIGYGPNAAESNDARFALPAFDRLFEQQAVLPDGPQRQALMRRAQDLLVAYMPYKVHLHRIVNDLSQPRVDGYVRHPFMRDLWRYVALDG